MANAITIVSWTLMFFVLSTESKAHEFEDGFVERSMAVVIRDNIARVEYSIGLNPKTKVQLIKFWSAQDPASSAVTEVDGENETNSISSARSVDFLQLAGDNVSRRLRVLADGNTLKPQLISSLASARHHVDVTVTMEFLLPLNESGVSMVVEIFDGNFLPPAVAESLVTQKLPNTTNQGDGEQSDREQSEAEPSTAKEKVLVSPEGQLLPAPFGGAFRYAIKSKGNAVLNRSNVASILIRAKRQLDANFSEAELGSAYNIQAELVIVQ